ncbi:AAA family ATPase [Acidibrevibacterium fodinaquatile]|uniref:AAA family ATPase n=3 Tax=Acidibrevibacterium fodinaquatile TaxID=1969806 RepID=UPI0023DDAFCB|nr:AAA family ATPase [Acidibrevibacterium fodinaquatile]
MVHAEHDSSVVGLAAYIARARRSDDSGSVYNFAHRGAELLGHGLILPGDAPDWAHDPAALWRAAERAEQTIDRQSGERRWKKGGQIARHMTIALPREVTPEQREAMLLAFIATELQPERHGVAVEWAIHADDHNPHAHLLISTRALGATGFGKKARAMNPGFASRGAAHFVSDGDDWDKRWAAFQDAWFARAGLAVAVPERRGMAEPHYRRGQMRSEAVCRERDAIAEANAAVAEVRKRDPEAILASLTAHKSIFTARDLRRALNASGLEGEARAALEAALRTHPETVALVDPRGEGIGWTTKTARAEEVFIRESAKRLAETSVPALNAAAQRLLDAAELSDEQRQAAARMTTRSRLAIVIGRAGTGKSHTLQAVRRAFEQAGKRVIGLAPTNAVVADLRRDGYRQAATLHRELGALARDPKRWDRNTVVMVDEAAMVDNTMLATLLAAAERCGARLILAGDDRQFASVARGGMFSELVAEHGAAELTEVRRQRQAYQAQASADFARGDILTALRAYNDRGQIVWCDSLEAARAQAVAAQAETAAPGFLYASTNDEVEALNRREQQRRREAREAAGETLTAFAFATVRGAVSLAGGERVQFYRTDRAIGVAASEFGTVRRVTAEWLEVVKDDGAVIGFDPSAFDQWGLGYSGTGYKGQGKTQPRTAAVYDNPFAWDARAAYVIGTRHRDDYRLFVPRDLAPDLDALAEQILRPRDDRGSSLRFDTAEDYQARQQQRAATASKVFRAALDNSRAVRAAKAARKRLQSEGQAPPNPGTVAKPAAPAADSVSPSSPSPPPATSDDVAATLSRYRDVFVESGHALREMAGTWRGSAAEKKELVRLVTCVWQAARAIVDDPGLFAALRQQRPGQAPLVEGFARQSRDEVIAQALQQMPQPRPEPEPKPEPEPDPEPPGFGMGMR